MTQEVQSTSSQMRAKKDWETVLRGDRAAFQATIKPYLGELFEAARRELRYRTAIGDLRADDLTADELVGDVLARAWRDRNRRPLHLGLRAWLLALLFRVVENTIRREMQFRRLAEVSLEQPPPPESFYDDDESFWEWHQPDDLTRWEDVVGKPAVTPEEFAAADEELTRTLDPLSREVFLMSEHHRIELPELAIALGISVAEAAARLVEARRRVGIPTDDKVL